MPTILDIENSACYIGLFQRKSVPHYPPRQMDFCKFSREGESKAMEIQEGGD